MATLDVFRQDPFTTMSMTTAVERNPFKPTGLGELNLFSDVPIRDKAAMVEERNGALVVVPTSPRGAPPTERQGEKRKARYFDVPRIALSDTLHADELQSVRAFGQESELVQVQAEVARRLSAGHLRHVWHGAYSCLRSRGAAQLCGCGGLAHAHRHRRGGARSGRRPRSGRDRAQRSRYGWGT